MTVYDVGDAVKVSTQLKDDAGTLTNATVVLAVTKPDGTTLAPAPTVNNPSTGNYNATFLPDAAGTWRYKWTATGALTAVDLGQVSVIDSSRAVVSLTSMKNWLNIAAADTSQDDELREALETATDVAEDIVGILARRTFTEKHSGRGQPSIVLHNTPVISITSVTENGVALAATEYSLSDEGILTRASAYTAGAWLCGVDNITVVQVAGRTVIKAAIQEGVKELVRINFRPQQGGNYSPFDQGDSDDYGTRDQGGEVRLGFYIPNRVMQMFKPDALPPGIA